MKPLTYQTEQMVTCIRHVDDNLDVHEEFIRLHNMQDTAAESITLTIMDVLLRLILRISNCRGQCYDGASTMSGIRTGVATRLTALEPKALYTHCLGHSLNLAIQDVMKGIDILKDTIITVYEITKLIKKSPKREAIFDKFQAQVNNEAAAPGIRMLCPTRWTVRAETLNSILENYTALQLEWDESKKATHDSEMNARIGDVSAQMEKFNFLFGLELGKTLLKMADNRSRHYSRNQCLPVTASTL